MLCGAALKGSAAAQIPRFTAITVQTNKEVLLKFSAPTGLLYRIEHSPDLNSWHGLTTFPSTGNGATQYLDSAAPFVGQRFYRALQVPGGSLTGDHLTTETGEAVIHPVNHASFVIGWDGKMIYNDPVSASRFTGLSKADLILVSHVHGDHFDASAINALKNPDAVIVASRAIYDSMSATLRMSTTVLTNGQSTNFLGVGIEAIAMYNITPGRLTNHPKGIGNGYVITLGGRRIYMCGDSEDTVEMRALTNIDMAFLCMNLPFTMTPDQAADAARVFRPRVVYPYHYQSSDVNRFKVLVGTDVGVEVRLRSWY